MNHGYDTRPARLDDDEDDDEEEAEKKAKTPDMLNKSLLDQRVILVCKPVDRELMAQITAQLLFLEQDAPGKPITMYINCPGGDADSGFGIYDAMRFVTSPITTVCMGLAASAAIIIFLAGAKGKRFTLPNSRFLIHQPSTQGQGTASDLEITANEIVKLREAYLQIVADECGKTLKQCIKDANRDFWLTAQEAVDYKLASKIINSRADVG